jgi:hypothetical protein
MEIEGANRRTRRVVAAAACAAVLGLAAPAALVSPAQAAAGVPVMAVTLDADTSNCVATVVIAGQWANGLVAQVTLRNVGTTTWHSWRAVIVMPPGWRIIQFWNGYITQTGTIVTVNGDSTVAPGGTVTFGFGATGTGTAGPVSVTCTGF